MRVPQLPLAAQYLLGKACFIGLIELQDGESIIYVT
jgi:hypothetical protein